MNVAAMKEFAEQVEADPGLAKKEKRVVGTWNFEEGKPQLSATLAYNQGEREIEVDFAPFMGGLGLAPDPIQYCLFGTAACYAGTFAGIAAEKGVQLRGLKVVAENRVDLSRSLGLSNNPVVEQVAITLYVDSDAETAVLEELEHLATERCPGVYCLTNPIPLETRVERTGLET